MTGQRLVDNDIVISSRITLSRNVAEYPFVGTCSVQQLAEIASTLSKRLHSDSLFGDVSFDESPQDSFEKQLLADIESLGHCGVMGHSFSSAQDSLQSQVKREMELGSAAIKINDQDHLQISATRHDGDLLAAWNRVSELDDGIEHHFAYAFSRQWGYLTSCPSDIGTGMRIYSTVFLPGLAATGQADRVFRDLQRKNLIARSVSALAGPRAATGEKTINLTADDQAPDLLRINNLNTLGVTEVGLLQHFEATLQQVVERERESRDAVLAQPQSMIESQIHAAVEEICRSALTGQTNQTRNSILLSRVRFGISIGLVSSESNRRVLQSFSLASQRRCLADAISSEDYSQAAEIRDRIRSLEDQMGYRNDDSEQL